MAKIKVQFEIGSASNDGDVEVVSAVPEKGDYVRMNGVSRVVWRRELNVKDNVWRVILEDDDIPDNSNIEWGGAGEKVRGF